jgi:hypothetical protein
MFCVEIVHYYEKVLLLFVSIVFRYFTSSIDPAGEVPLSFSLAWFIATFIVIF